MLKRLNELWVLVPKCTHRNARTEVEIHLPLSVKHVGAIPMYKLATPFPDRTHRFINSECEIIIRKYNIFRLKVFERK